MLLLIPVSSQDSPLLSKYQKPESITKGVHSAAVPDWIEPPMWLCDCEHASHTTHATSFPSMEWNRESHCSLLWVWQEQPVESPVSRLVLNMHIASILSLTIHCKRSQTYFLLKFQFSLILKTVCICACICVCVCACVVSRHTLSMYSFQGCCLYFKQRQKAEIYIIVLQEAQFSLKY